MEDTEAEEEEEKEEEEEEEGGKRDLELQARTLQECGPPVRALTPYGKKALLAGRAARAACGLTRHPTVPTVSKSIGHTRSRHPNTTQVVGSGLLQLNVPIVIIVGTHKWQGVFE